MYVMCMWCTCDVHLMCMWCACDVHVMCMWCTCDTHLMCMWCASDLHVMCMWCVCDVHVMCMWCACDVHVMCMWCACDKHTMWRWCTCDCCLSVICTAPSLLFSSLSSSFPQLILIHLPSPLSFLPGSESMTNMKKRFMHLRRASSERCPVCVCSCKPPQHIPFSPIAEGLMTHLLMPGLPMVVLWQSLGVARKQFLLFERSMSSPPLVLTCTATLQHTSSSAVGCCLLAAEYKLLFSAQGTIMYWESTHALHTVLYAARSAVRCMQCCTLYTVLYAVCNTLYCLQHCTYAACNTNINKD